MKHSLIIDRLFTWIWNLQITIMAFKHKFTLFFCKYVKLFTIIGICIFVSFFLIVIFILLVFKFTIPERLIYAITGSSLFFILILHIIRFLLAALTHVRCFFIVSILFNVIISVIISNYFHNNPQTEKIISFIIFSALFFFMSLLANAKVAKFANTFIEIVLGLISLIKVFIAYAFDSYIFPQIPSTIDEAVKIKEAFSIIESAWLNQIDFALLPLLIINGIALLLCEIHSYWIETYNNNDDITDN